MSEIRTDTINNASGDNDSGIDLSTNDQVSIKTANTTAVTVDANQRVGIGTTTPASNCEIESTGDTTLRITAGGTSNDSKIDFVHGTTVDGGITFDHNGAYASEQMAFRAGNNTPHMYLTGAGYALFGTSSLPSSSVVGFSISPSIVTTNPHFSSCGSATGSVTHFNFINGNGTVGNITTNAGATAFNTSSDHRLKENVTADWDATTRLKQLNPVRFNFIADADTTVDGFLAHEVQSVVPEAITGTHNEVDDEGNPVYQSIDQSKLVPLLVKTIQELEARITALENA